MKRGTLLVASEDLPRNLSLEKPQKKTGEKPIDLETAWGDSENDLPVQEDKNHFAVYNNEEKSK